MMIRTESGEKLDLEVGDVFTTPIDAGRVSLGQVVGTAHEYGVYIIVFEGVWLESEVGEVLDHFASLHVRFSGSTTVNPFEDGVWRVVGRLPINPDDYLPAYTVNSTFDGRSGRIITDWRDERQRWATPDEVDNVVNAFSLTPNGFVNAAQAAAGVIEWQKHYDRILASKVHLARDVDWDAPTPHMKSSYKFVGI